MEFPETVIHSKVNVQNVAIFANTISQTFSTLADSGDNSVLLQSIQDCNQSLFEFVCLILLLFFCKMEVSK